jgi:CarD family transcriptional regulator
MAAAAQDAIEKNAASRDTTISAPPSQRTKPNASRGAAPAATPAEPIRDQAPIAASSGAKEEAIGTKALAQTKTLAQDGAIEKRIAHPVVASTPPLASSERTAPVSTPASSETIAVAKATPAKAVNAKPSPAPTVAAPAALGAASAQQKPAPAVKAKTPANKLGFKTNEFIVYPAHGVGQIIAIEVQEVAGFSLELFVVSFIKDKMILKVPTSKVAAVGMRKLAEADVVEKALSTLSGRARIKRTMWSRRAQEYEAKINSGDLVTIAEVVRDLYRSDTQPEQSYSERQLYEAALDRMAREVAAVRKLIDSESLKLIESFLLKGPRRGPKSDADQGDDAGDDDDVERAA